MGCIIYVCVDEQRGQEKKINFSFCREGAGDEKVGGGSGFWDEPMALSGGPIHAKREAPCGQLQLTAWDLLSAPQNHLASAASGGFSQAA